MNKKIGLKIQLKQSNNGIEKRVRKKAEETLKRETRQAEELKKYLEEIKKIPALSVEEEKELWKRKKIIETGGDEVLEKKIFNAYRKLTVSVANKLKKKPAVGEILTCLELILLAEKILPRIIKSYGWHRDKIKIDFSLYATYGIEQGIIRYYIDIARILEKGEPLNTFLQQKKETNKRIFIIACGEKKDIRVLEEFSGKWEEFEKYAQTIPEKNKWKVLEKETVITGYRPIF